MKSDTDFDLLVVGGGPAGSTLASIVKKYNPQKRVAILEREKFPRHHIGESLLPGILPILDEMGALKKVAKAAFLRKIGGTYIWGANRKPWEVNFADDGETRGINRFDSAWQVHRARYDQILLDHAEEMGAKVFQSHTATKFEAGEQAHRILVHSPRHPDGRWICARFLADCSGQGGFLNRYFRIRRMYRKLSNVAVYAYYRVDPFAHGLAGSQDASRIVINSVGDGWIWYIPLSRDTVSVGFVCKNKTLSARQEDLAKFYEARLRRDKRLWRALGGARRMDDMDGTGREFFVIQDYSYTNVQAAGDRWICAGDSAYFVDPIISTGVFMAQMTGLRAAYTINTLWRTPEPAQRQALHRDYNMFVRDLSGAFFQMALFWYGEIRSMRQWCKLARKFTIGDRRPAASDLQAFIHLTSGSRPYRGSISEETLLGLEAGLTTNAVLRSRKQGYDATIEERLPPIPGYWKPNLKYPYHIHDCRSMVIGKGLLAKTHKYRFSRAGKESALDPAVATTPESVMILSWLDGKTDVETLARRLAGSRRFAYSDARRLVNNFLSELHFAGAVG